MTTSGNYCKAYYVRDFARFGPWRTATALAMKQQETELDATADASSASTSPTSSSRPLQDDDYLFLQDTFIVTDGIFLDDPVIFADVTPEWEAFCRQELGFDPDASFAVASASAPATAS